MDTQPTAPRHLRIFLKGMSNFSDYAFQTEAYAHALRASRLLSGAELLPETIAVRAANPGAGITEITQAMVTAQNALIEAFESKESIYSIFTIISPSQ